MPPMAQNKNIHAGHRQRLKEQFRDFGIEPMSDVTALELLLFYAVPQGDTNPIAHRLIDTFGSYEAVFSASHEELTKVKGVSDHTAILLRMVPEIARRQQIRLASVDAILLTTEMCGDYLMPYFAGEDQEVVYLLGLDAKCKALGCVKIFEGSVNYATFSTRRVAEAALSMNATSVILAHNHTSGIAVPSKEDIRTTRTIKKALDMLGILLSDHIVVAGNDYVSMAESGMLEDYSNDQPLVF